jgi:hypothetical protein
MKGILGFTDELLVSQVMSVFTSCRSPTPTIVIIWYVFVYVHVFVWCMFTGLRVLPHFFRVRLQGGHQSQPPLREVGGMVRQ